MQFGEKLQSVKDEVQRQALISRYERDDAEQQYRRNTLRISGVKEMENGVQADEDLEAKVVILGKAIGAALTNRDQHRLVNHPHQKYLRLKG